MTRSGLAVASVILALAGGRATAEPGRPLGESSKGGVWWSESSPLAVTPIWATSRHGGLFVYDWQASVEGIEIDHARFYELVDRPDLARARKLRVGLGALAILGGVAAGALGARTFVDGRNAGLALLGGGVAAAFTGAYFVITPDPISASEAQQLADNHRSVEVSVGGRF